MKKISVTVFKKKFILARTACLGNNVKSSTLNKKLLTINFQKSRADHITNFVEFGNSLNNLFKMIPRNDLWRLIYMQSIDFFGFKASPEFIILDSYSELTDQRFSKPGTSDDKCFYANYTDVDKSSALEAGYICDGLLKLNEPDCYKLYSDLFNNISSSYGKEVPIIFINFSTALDPREKFKNRSDIIERVIKKITDENRFNLSFIKINDDNVFQSSDDEFYYHYSEETYNIFREEFVNIIHKIGMDEYLKT